MKNFQMSFNGEDVHKFCIERWKFYELQDGVYLPSIHDKHVFKEASERFGIPEETCEYWFNKIEKPLGKKKAREAIRKGKALEVFDQILRENGESPWGVEEIHKKFYSIISGIEKSGIKDLCLTICCSSGNHLSKLGFNNPIVILKHQNGDVEFVDRTGCNYIIEIKKLSSVICDISGADDESSLQNKMFKIRMENGNIVTFYFNLQDK